MKIRSNEIELISIDSLIPHPKNCHTHSPDQISRLSKLIEYQGFRNPVIAQKGTNLIVAGHGRILAAKKLGMKEVPVSYQEFESEEQLYAYIVSDNSIGKDTWATLDLNLISKEALDFGPNFDLDMLGLKEFNIDLKDLKENNDVDSNNNILDKNDDEYKDNDELNKYSKKITSPVYTPKKDIPPDLSELFSLEKYDSLVKEIKIKKLPKDIELFLINAASRHIVFNYENIAEFYCHQEKGIQELMEKSALIIIDFNKAIEGGFVKLSQEIKNILDQNNIEVDNIELEE